MRPGKMSPLLLLDTHVLTRYVFEEFKARQRALVDEIDRAREEGGLRVCAITIWEVGMLESKGRIQLDMDCLEWVREALRRSGAVVVPMSPEIAVASTRLPGEFRGDPADRIILATARHFQARLVTADQNMKAYAERGFVDVLPV